MHTIHNYQLLLDGDNKGAVFLYDLGSSYGTICNKVKLTPHTYYMLRTGYVIKFGASTRLYIVKVCRLIKLQSF